MKKIQINPNIFPVVMSISLSENELDDDRTEENMSIIKRLKNPKNSIDLPRGAHLLYLKKIMTEHIAPEDRLLEQYATGASFTDTDYQCLLNILMTDVNRQWLQASQTNFLNSLGVQIEKSNNGNLDFVLIESAIPYIRVEAWECIIIDLLHNSAFEIIECFDFNAFFSRQENDENDSEYLKISLNAWKFTSNITEQSLSNSLRSAFMFTLIGYCFGDVKDQYNSFNEYFDAEFFKRASLVYGLWSSRGTKSTIEYIPLYDSFYNLDKTTVQELVDILKALLDNESVALDEKLTLKNRLIEGAGEFHNNISATDIALEQNLIKPALNFILLREKAIEAIKSAETLFSDNRFADCASRCHYAMMFSLKALMENKGLLAKWKKNELKERETHDTLEIGLDKLVAQGVLDNNDKFAFSHVKDQRWKCDYSLYKFEKADALNCIIKAKDFYSKIEMLTM